MNFNGYWTCFILQSISTQHLRTSWLSLKFFFNFSLPLQSLSAHLLDLELDIDPFHAIVTFKISFSRCLLLLLDMEMFFFSILIFYMVIIFNYIIMSRFIFWINALSHFYIFHFIFVLCFRMLDKSSNSWLPCLVSYLIGKALKLTFLCTDSWFACGTVYQIKKELFSV